MRSLHLCFSMALTLIFSANLYAEGGDYANTQHLKHSPLAHQIFSVQPQANGVNLVSTLNTSDNPWQRSATVSHSQSWPYAANLSLQYDIEQPPVDWINAGAVSGDIKSQLSAEPALAAVKTTEHNLTMSMPLSIVNLPIAVEVTPKLQTIESYTIADSLSAYRSNSDTLAADSQVTSNLDVGVALEPVDGLVVGVSGRNLVPQTISVDNPFSVQAYDYQLAPLYNAGIAYQWRALSVSSDIDLNANQGFTDIEDSQYVRFAGALKATDWLSVSLGYRHDMLEHEADIYTIGTGMSFGPSFSIDFTGLVDSDAAVGGVLKTSYYF